eukprot:5773843-Pyramimonas_sp.AAC.1
MFARRSRIGGAFAPARSVPRGRARARSGSGWKQRRVHLQHRSPTHQKRRGRHVQQRVSILAPTPTPPLTRRSLPNNPDCAKFPRGGAAL